MPLSMEATDGLSRGEELEVSRENSSGSSSRHKAASSSFVAVIAASAFLLQQQRIGHATVPYAARSPVSLEPSAGAEPQDI
jgi:hypothetical protein